MRFGLVAVTMIGAGAITAAGGIHAALSQDMQFGDPDSLAFSQALYAALEEANLIGPNAARSYAYQGNEPHGAILEQVETNLAVEGQTGTVIVKTNFMADGLTPQQVMDAPIDEYLVATTVMFKREAGYNPDAEDWFWAKYLPDASLDQTPDGVQLAGRVPGCIGCHQGASGGDFVFLHDRYVSE